MTNYKLRKLLKLALSLTMILFMGFISHAQTLPYTVQNNSDYADDQVYVAIVGITDGHVWVDPVNGQVNPMNTGDNTIPGPIINGNQGPGENGLYANCFRKLSDIPNKTINIPKIAGCRIMISFESQLYLYFFGHSGAPSGYSAPNLANPTDPNQGIKFELVELTFNDLGLWTNTSRVDSYQYPVGLEVWGNNFYKKVGELKSHAEIISQWQSSAPTEFQSMLNVSEGIIHFPTKTGTFPTNFLQDYIDAIWSKYTSQQLAFSSGDAGIWRGNVQGTNFVFTRDSDGQVATIPGKPSTIEAMEGSGVMASGARWDLVVQAQFVAAITRHAINLNIGSGVLQDFGNTANYYQTWPYNWYAKFFHQNDVSFEGQTYAFAYDDVFDQSATIHTPNPTNITITLGGFEGIDDNADNGVSGLEGTYLLENRNSGLVMEIANGNAANGTNVWQGNNTGAANQQFTFTETSTGVYSLINVQTGKAVDIAGISAANNANVHQWTYVGGGNQQFKAESVGNGHYKFKATHSNKILQVENGSTNADANINQYDDNDQLTGQWKLLPVGGNAWSTQIEAENFVASYDVATEPCSEGGENVGYINTGSWMVWDVNIPSGGAYTVEYRVASPLNGGAIQLEQAGGSTVYGTVNVPSTNGWQDWVSVSHSVNLNSGQQQIAIKALNGGWNINWLKITSNTGARIHQTKVVIEDDRVIRVFPNPVVDQLNFQLPTGEEMLSLQIYDMTGKMVSDTQGNQKLTSSYLDVSNLLQGNYLVKIRTTHASYHSKIIKK